MYTLPELPYNYDALEPHIDAQTMTIHHTKHHQGYTDKLNKAIEGQQTEETIEALLRNISSYNDAVRNNAGGFYNHSLFWKILTPNKTELKEGALKEAIETTFGSFEDFKTKFSSEAGSRFGSGWAWLCKNKNGSLFITSTPNQDNPLMDVVEDNGTPILGLDVWEHAYYLKYQNKRPDYINAFFELINWDEVENNYNS